eukprot:758771-Hanusia_phi.AAC.3
MPPECPGCAEAAKTWDREVGVDVSDVEHQQTRRRVGFATRGVSSSKSSQAGCLTASTTGTRIFKNVSYLTISGSALVEAESKHDRNANCRYPRANQLHMINLSCQHERQSNQVICC